MFGFKIIHKRELALYAAQIQDFRNQIKELGLIIEHERKRAEGAINLLLIKTQKAAITPEPNPVTEKEEEEAKAKLLNIFGDNEEEASLIERIQDVG